MSIFGGSKPKVTKREFRETRGSLRGAGFTSEQIRKVENIFHGSMDESSTQEKGIDSKEIEKGIEYIKKNKSSLGFSDNRIKKLEEQLRRRL